MPVEIAPIHEDDATVDTEIEEKTLTCPNCDTPHNFRIGQRFKTCQCGVLIDDVGIRDRAGITIEETIGLLGNEHKNVYREAYGLSLLEVKDEDANEENYKSEGDENEPQYEKKSILDW